MGLRGFILIMGLLVVTAPRATAGGAVDAGLVSIEVVDGYPVPDCSLPATGGICLGRYSAGSEDGFGDDELEVYGDSRSVRIAFSPGWLPVEQDSLVPLLPSGEFGFASADLVVSHPTFVILHSTDSFVESAIPIDSPADVDVDERGIVVEKPVGESEDGWGWDDTYFMYERTRVPDDLVLDNTDEWLILAEREWCDAAREELQALGKLCDETGWRSTAPRLEQALPSINVGAAVRNVSIASSESGIGSELISSQDVRESLRFLEEAASRPFERVKPALTPSPETLPSTPHPPREDAPQESAETSRPSPSDSVWANNGDRYVSARISQAALAAALLAYPLWSLYRRIANRDLPSQSTRQRLLSAVAKSPGLSMSELARRLGLDHKGADYHVRRLEAAGYLRAERSPRLVRLFPPGSRPRDPRAAAIADAVQHPVSRAILLDVARVPGTTCASLASRVSAPRSTLEWHVSRLAESGLLVRTRQGAAKALALAPGPRETVVDALLGFEAAREPSPPRGSSSTTA